MPLPPAWPSRSSGPNTSFRAYSTRRSLRPWRARSRARPSGPEPPAAARAPTRPYSPERVDAVDEPRANLGLLANPDATPPIGEVKRLEAAIHAGADVAVGSRALPDPSVSRQ